MQNQAGNEHSKTGNKPARSMWLPPVLALCLGLSVSEGLCRLFFESPFVGRTIATGMLYHPRWGAIHEPGASYRSQNAADKSDFGMSINEQGFRNPTIGNSSDDTFRMIFIGDSFTEGYGVEVQDGLVAQTGLQFEKHLPQANVEVINTGIRGGSPSTYRRQLERYLALDPDGLVLVAFDNDLADDFYYSSDADYIRADAYGLIQRLPFESRLIEMVAELGVRARQQWATKRGEAIVGGMKLRAAEPIYGSGTVDTDPLGFYVHPDLWEPHWQWTRKYLTAIAKESSQRELPLAIVYIPCPQTGIHGDCCSDLYPVAEGKRPGEDSAYRDWLREFASTWDLPFVDVSRTFLELEAAGDEELVFDLSNGHLNARGNALVGELVRMALQDWVNE